MRRATDKLAALLLLTASAAFGCSERTTSAQLPDDAGKRYAAAFCAAESNCGCQVFESRAACEAEIAAAFDEALPKAEASAFDEACFERLLAEPGIQGCAEPSAVTPLCNAIAGTKPVGAPCEHDARLFTVLFEGGCEAGTVCDRILGQCSLTHSEIPSPQLGEPCDPTFLFSCGLGGTLYCGLDGICLETTPSGEPCSHVAECAGLSHCATATGVCTEMHEIGEPCDPADRDPCLPDFVSPTTGYASWCNPGTGICEASPPYVCWILG